MMGCSTLSASIRAEPHPLCPNGSTWNKASMTQRERTDQTMSDAAEIFEIAPEPDPSLARARASNTPLHEQYRPNTWEEVVGQDKALARIATIRRRALSGRAYCITGQSGTGKTTIARLIAREIADDLFIEEIDAGELTATRPGDFL